MGTKEHLPPELTPRVSRMAPTSLQLSIMCVRDFTLLWLKGQSQECPQSRKKRNAFISSNQAIHLLNPQMEILQVFLKSLKN